MSFVLFQLLICVSIVGSLYEYEVSLYLKFAQPREVRREPRLEIGGREADRPKEVEVEKKISSISLGQWRGVGYSKASKNQFNSIRKACS